jgi:16S rRNA (cytosine967-C5)-methyltransferase
MPRVHVACTEAEAWRVRPLVLAAYDEARASGWPFLSDVLARALRGAAPDDGAVASALVHALVKYDRLLGFAAESELSAARLDALLRMARGAETDVGARIDAIAAPLERLAVAYSFPDWIVARLARELGDAAVERALARMNEPAPRVVRANTLKTTRHDVMAALAAEGFTAAAGAYAPQAVVLEGRGALFRTASFARGDFEVQDEASQIVAELVAPPPRSFVVDACAGAGGKTLALAALLGGKGRVLGLDTSASKLDELRRRARRAGASNVEAAAMDLLDPGLEAEWARAGRPPSVRVLLDAPCSGLGAVRRNPETRWRLRPEDLDRLVATQGALARAAAGLVAEHGRLVVATCSFLPSEGARVVEEFLAERPDFVAVTVRDVLGRARTAAVSDLDGRHLRTWRFEGAEDGSEDGNAPGVDGFFAAVLRRRRSTP